MTKLQNTAVKPNNEIEEKAIIALYELAGFKKHENYHVEQWAVADLVGLDLNGKIIRPSVNDSKYKHTTLDQLAWGYGLTPEWATTLKTDRDLIFFADNTKKVMYLHNMIQTYINIDESMCQFDTISTRPQQDKTETIVEKYTGKAEQEWMPEVGDWDGEILPPVGTRALLSDECNFMSLQNGGITSACVGTLVEVVGHAKRPDNGNVNVVLMCVDNLDWGSSVGNHEWIIKPLPTPKEVEREEFISEWVADMQSLRDSGFTANNWHRAKAYYAEGMYKLGYRKAENKND